MHRALSSRWLRSALRIGDRAALAEVPGYLCPALSLSAQRGRGVPHQTTVAPGQRRCLHAESNLSDPLERLPSDPADADALALAKLPLQCHGCGAFTQTTEPDQAGYYDLNRKSVQKFAASEHEYEIKKGEIEEDFVVTKALEGLDEHKLQELGLDPRTLLAGEDLETDIPSFPPAPNATPLCNRCHALVHHRKGTPIFHPSVDALRETIEESPFKNNHIYHVIDAADFPMSLVPKLHQLLGDVSLRRRNRRSRAGRYYKDRKFDMSFIITRSDLLAPTEKQVNALMPYLREVLRSALGEFGDVVRLGNLKCVSARRSWWTKDLKQEIYKRGGAGWMVGKVNVGKSQLFQAVFPKGTTADIPFKNAVEVSMFSREEDDENIKYLDDGAENYDERLDLDALLPPARPESNYPEMPTVSSLPGTTASPIRIPYGNGKGELIDLPGLVRSDLELFVQEDKRQALVMQDRLKPEQHSIKPGQSLLLGGLIRITPRTPDLVFLGYNFTPLPEHLTSTDKAVAFQAQERTAAQVDNICTPDAADKMQLAGSFPLRHDVTKLRAGPITRKNAINIKVENLPYRVLSTDILIEGVGWVEMTAQVRARQLFAKPEATAAAAEPVVDDNTPEDKPQDPFDAILSRVHGAEKEKPKEPPVADKKTNSKAGGLGEPVELNWPVVDVYSPLGKFVGVRPPMNGYMLNKPRVLAKHKKARPRRSMKGAKKRDKMARRDAAAASAPASTSA
ncbi:hypothetical protein D7B24_007780 [Verticillium nonalfalfae]|uniref:Genetic interactor of prohibitins 3, mitochondrial n=1 Tax=Verticillium nonalfalfae TaxID=1051616 RepID=A0A3M9Y6Z0_9PEZI|nr:uncharacterized protein D7B24_007780 [Verticillium nonalfalfae]RNJ56001.1 hypothetical protein D7B24_007780 [Verticillium nonalfalfae]